MKHIITPVGTSLLKNYTETSDGRRLAARFQVLEDEPATRWEDRSDYIDRIRGSRRFAEWIQQTPDASAEIESLRSIARELDDHIDVYLLASDTIKSRLVAELIADHADIEGVDEIHFNPSLDVIQGLQVRDRNAFRREGLNALVARLDRLIRNNSPDHTRVNITGGYKATIPYVSLMAQLYNVATYYKFADSDAIIEIPEAPIVGDMKLVEQYEEPIAALAEGVEDWPAFKNQHAAFCRNAPGMIQADDEVAFLSPVGEILWRRYQTDWVFYYAPDDVESQIQQLPNIRDILAKKVDVMRSNTKLEKKGDHYVFDDGNNQNRIYYFSEDDDLYIYKVFQDEEAAQKYIQTSFGPDERAEILHTAKRRRLAAKSK